MAARTKPVLASGVEMMRNLKTTFAALLVAGLAPAALAAEGGGIAHTVDYYGMVASALGLGSQWIPTIGSLFLTALILLAGVKYRAAVQAAGNDVVPDGKCSLRFAVDSMLDVAYNLAKDNLGDAAKRFMPLMGSLFVFILVANVSGMIPGFPPPTAVMEMNVAMGLVVFFAYNIAGLKEHGISYLKHFTGPAIWIAPLFFLIELASHGARPLSLGLRLACNIFADHMMLGVFTSMTYVVVPALLMFFGLLVSVVQSFVFTLLTGIYISMAIAHDH